MDASQSRTVHSKTHRVCPNHIIIIGPIGTISSTIPSPWIQPLPEGRSDMPWMIQRSTVPGKWLCPNHIRYISRPTGSLLSTQEILNPLVQYPVLYHHLESSPYPKAGLICHERSKELLYQENGCVPNTCGTFQDPQGLSYPHKKYWTHQSNIQYYIPTLNRALTQGRSDMPWMIQRVTITGRWLLPNHVRYIPRPTGSVLSTQEILNPLVQYPVLYQHLESSPYPKAGLICHERSKELLYQENGCVPNTCGTFQDPQGLSYPHKKYWTHQSNIQYYIITLNRALTQGRSDMPWMIQRVTITGRWLLPNHVRYIPRPMGLSYQTRNIGFFGPLSSARPSPWIEYLPNWEVWYSMNDSKSYSTRKMSASQSCTLHSITHRICTIRSRNIGLIAALSSTKSSPWYEALPN